MPKQDTSGKRPKPGGLAALSGDANIGTDASSTPPQAPSHYNSSYYLGGAGGPSAGGSAINSSGDITSRDDEGRMVGRAMLGLARNLGGRALGGGGRRR